MVTLWTKADDGGTLCQNYLIVTCKDETLLSAVITVILSAVSWETGLTGLVKRSCFVCLDEFLNRGCAANNNC